MQNNNTNNITQAPTLKKSSIGWNNKALSDVVLCIIPDKSNAKRKRNSPKKKDTSVEEIYVSKLFLAMQSSFFEKLFLNGMKESNQDKVNIVVESDQIRCFVDMLRFMYTGNYEEDIIQIAMLADKYQCHDVLADCAAILKKQITSASAANDYLTWKDTMSHVEGLTQLFETCDQMIITYFKQLQLSIFTQSDENDLFEENMALLQSLNEHAMEALLKSNQLVVYSENLVYSAFEKWLDADREARSVHIPKLLPHIRLPMCDTYFVEHVIAAHPVIGTSEIFKNKLLKECFAFGYTDQQLKEKAASGDQMFCHRTELAGPVPVEIEFDYFTEADTETVLCDFYLDGYPMFIHATCDGTSLTFSLGCDILLERRVLYDLWLLYYEYASFDEAESACEDEFTKNERSIILHTMSLDELNEYYVKDNKAALRLEIEFCD